MHTFYNRLADETPAAFCERIYSNKADLHLTWMDVADIINTELGLNFSPDKYRKEAYKFYEDYAVDEDFFEDTAAINDMELDDKYTAMRFERAKLADERTQVTALYRRIAREDSIKEIAHDAVSQISANIKLPVSNIQINKTKAEKEAILEISDWHYGIEIDNYWNVYNPEIAKERIAKLLAETKRICIKENVSTINVVNLGDLIAGRIHTQLRINSRFDVITQIIEVSELLAQFIAELGTKFKIEYYDTQDNHSRLEPNLKESLELETLTRITTWYLKERLPWLKIGENVFGDDIISFETLGHKVVGVHGHKDKPTKLIDSLNTYTQVHYDLALSAHLHHFSANESNNTILICNGSMMGTDDFAEKLRLNSKASQNLIIASKTSPCENIYRIVLN